MAIEDACEGDVTLLSSNEMAASSAHLAIHSSACSPEEAYYDALSALPCQISFSFSSTEKKSAAKPSKASLEAVDSLQAVIFTLNNDNPSFDTASTICQRFIPKNLSARGLMVRSTSDLLPWGASGDEVELGSGTTGTVYLYAHAVSHRPVALKVMSVPPKDCCQEDRRQVISKLKQEVRILTALGNKDWFPEFYGCIKVGPDTVGIAMEFCGDESKGKSYSIADCVEGYGPHLSRDDWMGVMQDVADGLIVMHRRGFLCNDLKEDNVLVVESEGEWGVKIVDFGWSSSINKPLRLRFTASQKQGYKDEQIYSQIAPECALDGKPCSVSSDVYALGRLTAFVGQRMGLKDLEDFGMYIYKCPREKRPSLKDYIAEVTCLRNGGSMGSESSDDSNEDL
ncbi:uncharacterized protein [Diadema setosum]|uniref:uncharacterized protein n=1 Tax=Diadema setosum TaxID=31175 RepID=UPI003B3BE49C